MDAETLELLGEVALQTGDLLAASQRFEEAVVIFQRVFTRGYAGQWVRTLLRQARLALLEDRIDAALALCNQVITTCIDHDEPDHTMALWATLLVAECARRQGRMTDSKTMWEAALSRLMRYLGRHPVFERLKPYRAVYVLSPLDITL